MDVHYKCMWSTKINVLYCMYSTRMQYAQYALATYASMTLYCMYVCMYVCTCMYVCKFSIPMNRDGLKIGGAEVSLTISGRKDMKARDFEGRPRTWIVAVPLHRLSSSLHLHSSLQQFNQHTYIHTYICTYIHTYVLYVCMHVCNYVCMYACI